MRLHLACLILLGFLPFAMIGSAVAHAEVGIASNYCDRVTANGEHMRCSALMAAHRTLPFNTKVRVSTARRSVTVRINDRGPFIRGRVIDLTPVDARPRM